MRNKTFLRNKLAWSMALAALGNGLLTNTVLAQEEELQEIAVTGSRIRAPGITAPTPVTAVGLAELSNMAPGNLIESISQLPQFFNNTTQNAPGNFFGSPGSGGLNIRGLGTNRTLVLLDGRRSPPTNRLGVSDINVFPEALVQRLEVVTGGASASYGTDAVAGVANFILNKEFTGVDTHLQGGATTRGDNENWEGSFSFGADLTDKMHLLFSVEAFQQNRVTSFDDRKWFQSFGTVTNPDPTGPRDLIRPNVFSTQATVGGVISAPGSALNRLQFLSDGSATPFVAGDPSIVGAGTRSQSIVNGGSGTANSNLRPTLAPEAERANAFTYLDYDITDNLNVYVQGLWGKNQSTSTNLGGVFQNTTQMRIFSDNAFLPENLSQIMAQEGLDSFVFDRIGGPEDLAGNAFVRTETNTFSGTTGFDLTIAKPGFFQDWQVHGYYQAGRNKQRGRQIGGIALDRIFASIDAVEDPTTGSVVCRAALVDPANWSNCVPINLFGAGRASQEAVDFVTGFDPGQPITTPISFTGSGFDLGREMSFITEEAKLTKTNTTEHLFELSADGQLYDGWGAGAISMATGISWRREQITQLTFDPSNPSGDTSFLPILDLVNAGVLRGVPAGVSLRTTAIQFASVPNIKGSFEVKEAFGELLVPVVSDLPFIQQFNLSMAGRIADYTGSGVDWAWKFGGDWQITDELRLRTTGSHDVRAATLAERFDATGGTTSFTDPEFNNAQLDASLRTGGNPNVNPEKADTVTIGAVWQPAWLSGFSATVDYYRIHISGAIGQLGVQRIVDDCFAGAQNLCAQITRDPVTNRITLVENVFLNINESQAEGIDVEFNYNTPVTLFGGDAENLAWRFFGTWLNENSITNIGAPKVEQAGETGALSLPEFKFTTNITYSNGPISVFLQERWIDQGLLDADETTGVEIDDNTVRGAFYTDIRLSYNLEQNDGSSLEIFGTVTNLLDENPPVTAGFSTFTGTATQTNQSLFDVLGRRFVAGVRYRY
ncbi:MAG: TonB-dependent receptor [Pseudomonadales bacterium]|nr:TonB-dependent receptor [Pseudomonadales bacterium]